MSLTSLSNHEFNLDIRQAGDTFHVLAPHLAKSLGFREAFDLLRSIPDAEKGSELVRTPGGEQRVGYVTEAGFYRALGQRQASRIADEALRAQVERFQSWVYAEVLPSIRRHGGYLTPEATEAALTDPDFIIRLATSLKDERARRVELEAQAEVDAPKVAYVDTYVADSDLLTIRTLAANLNVGESWLRGLLIQKQWIYSETATRWSNQKQAKETVYRYSAYSHKRAYFAPRPVHDAPRFKGEVMHTLKVTPAGAAAIAKLVRLAQASLSVVGAEEVVPA